MRIMFSLCIAATLWSSTKLIAAVPASASQDTTSAKFSVSTETQVPGEILQPGSYSIRILDHLSDRLIVRIDNVKGANHPTFIGLPNPSLGKADRSGVIRWESGPSGTSAARGFHFPNGTDIEFVYPKAEAVALAKLNSSGVPAIDPASEGRVVNNGLSKDDMEVVTLWTLSSTKVGPDDAAPAIKAVRYQQVAGVSQKPVIARLPHTGSDLPLLALLSLLSLIGAGALRRYRALSTAS